MTPLEKLAIKEQLKKISKVKKEMSFTVEKEYSLNHQETQQTFNFICELEEAINMIINNPKPEPMFKTFKVLKYIDDQWTGQHPEHSPDYLSKIDGQINTFCKENNVNVDKVEYSTVNENIQIGPSVNNTSRRIYFVAAVKFTQ